MKRPIQAIETVLNKVGFDYTKCKTWTTDGFYRETKDLEIAEKDKRILAVYMDGARTNENDENFILMGSGYTIE